MHSWSIELSSCTSSTRHRKSLVPSPSASWCSHIFLRLSRRSTGLNGFHSGPNKTQIWTKSRVLRQPHPLLKVQMGNPGQHPVLEYPLSVNGSSSQREVPQRSQSLMRVPRISSTSKETMHRMSSIAWDLTESLICKAAKGETFRSLYLPVSVSTLSSNITLQEISTQLQLQMNWKSAINALLPKLQQVYQLKMIFVINKTNQCP